MRSQTAEHQTIVHTASHSILLLILWAFVWVAMLSGCVSWDAVRNYSQEKGARLLECQLQDVASAEQARACLGQYARDLGTQGCKDAGQWLETLPGLDDQHDADDVAQGAKAE